ncbi:MAG: DUF2975 domain-containing protein [Candidatus Aminicenantales bacterium]
MAAKDTFKVAALVKALRIVLITMLILYGMMVVTSLVVMTRVFPALVNLPSGAPVSGMISVFFDRVLSGAIYFFIAYSIFKLISLISRGEPFSSASPRYIRRIGYAVLCLAAINAVVNAISAFPRPAGFLSSAEFRFLSSGLSTLLLGFGFLVIARVIEAGVRLQQDQNLTV